MVQRGFGSGLCALEAGLGGSGLMWLSGISSLPFLEAPELSAARRTVGMKGTKAVLTEGLCRMGE